MRITRAIVRTKLLVWYWQAERLRFRIIDRSITAPLLALCQWSASRPRPALVESATLGLARCAVWFTRAND